MRGCCSDNIETVTAYETAHVAVASSIDCTIAVVFNHKRFDSSLEAFPLLFQLLCGDWFIHDQITRDLRYLLGSQEGHRGDEKMKQLKTSLNDDRSEADLKASYQLKEIRILMKNYYHASTFLNPEDYVTEETDFQYIQVLTKGWKEPQLKIRADQAVANVERMYQLAVDEENEEADVRRSARERLLNQGILWLGVLSVTGTVAGVCQYIDFQNDELNAKVRIASIAISGGAAVGAFLFLSCFGGRKKRSE